MTTSSKLALAEGTWISGKWNKNKYEVVRRLGEGANGQVYLVRSSKTAYALKVGFDTVDLQMEVNVLRSLDKGVPPGSRYLLEADDLTLTDRDYPFYVMRYVRGAHPQAFLHKQGMDWFEVLGYDLLKKLSALHRRGYIFGDLKMDNVIVSEFGQADLVDYGGVTEKGRSVKQFTEVYDRGYWNAGSRKADEAYDLFSFAVLSLHLADTRNRFASFIASLPQNRHLDDLIAAAQESPACQRFRPVLLKALTGQYRTSQEAAQEWRSLMLKSTRRTDTGKRSLWIQTAFAVSVLLFVSTLYIYFQR
ncbi:protein kinase domain-containing protein [Paenibacillus sp. HJGM_3]|uniref:protein kinase domain-containing protein n=1 Tax=Paenibacillus sp. HJGM_3 TaxID=3379816 RepID=UPI00385EDC0D